MLLTILSRPTTSPAMDTSSLALMVTPLAAG
jgi:hypothetical protein